MSIHELIGLYSAKKIYSCLSHQNHFPHAYLLYGTKGSGKTTLAVEFSKFFLAEKDFFSTSQIDLLWIQPSQNSSLIRLANIKGQSKDGEQPSVKEFLTTLPLTHSFKVVVIEEVHRLTLEAGHALLKILEEPPYFVKFILTTSQRHDVLSTIISRCLNISCELPSIKELNEKWPTTHLAEIIFSDNIPGRRHHLHNHLEIYQELYTIFESASTAFKLKTAEKFKNWCDQYAKQTQLSLRTALLEGLECLALWFIYFKQSYKAQKICQIYKTNIFNPNLGYLIDAVIIEVFCEYTLQNT